MDSDKNYSSAPLNRTKKRIIKEIKSVNGYVWVTKGREIENYISLQKFLELKSLPLVSKFDSIFDYMIKIKKKTGKKYYSNKVLLAENIRAYIFKENYLNSLDLALQLKSITTTIKKWNGVK